MNSKVNVKFVIILSSVLVAVFAGVALTFVTVFLKSGADHARAGDTAMAAGDYAAAERNYGKAVRRDRTNVEWLTKYRSALEQYETDNFTDYQTKYGLLSQTLQDLARAKGADLEAHEEYLQMVLRESMESSPTMPWQRLEEASEQSIAFFDAVPQDSDAWERLKRYRGLALTRRLMLGRDYNENLAARARDDLTRALAADPKDLDALADLVRIDFVQMRSLLQRQRIEEAREIGERTLSLTRTFVNENPDNPLAPLRLIEVENDPAMRQVMGITAPIDFAAVRAAIERSVELCRNSEDWEPDTDELSRLQHLEMVSTGSLRVPLTRLLVDELVEKHPNDHLLAFFRARLLARSGDTQEAINGLRKIIDAPNLPVSLDGLRLFQLRNHAIELISEYAFTLWENAGDDAQTRNDAVKMLRETDAALRERYSSDATSLLLTAGRLKYVENDLPAARRLLVQYVDDGERSDPQALWILSQIAAKNSNWTDQADRLERLIVVDPLNFRATLVLAELYGTHLRRDQRAIDLFERVISVMNEGPQRDEMVRRANVIRAMSGAGELEGDPVDSAIVKAFRIFHGSALLPGSSDEALAVLRDAINANDFDPRLVLSAMQMHVMRGEVQQATQVLRAGLQRHPNDQRLTRLSPLTQVQDLASFVDAVIDLSDQMSEARKLLAKADTRRERGAMAEARTLLAQAVEKDPNDPAVIEAAFRDAVERGDRSTALGFVERARAADMDGLAGLTFQARYEMSQGNDRRALDLLLEAKRQRGDHVNLLRLLALHQLSMGLNNDALATFREAIALRGTDTNLVSDYVGALVRMGRGPEALAALQELGAAAGGRRDLVELRLDLEAEHGNRAQALAARRAILQSEPANRVNKRKLTAMLIETDQFTEAKRYLDELRAEADELDVARLEAVWYAAQGDISGGRQVFLSYIGRVMQQRGPDAMTADPYLAMGGFLLRYRQVGDGLVALRQAKRYEDPETLVVEKSLGEALRTHARFEEAAESFRIIVEAGKDDSNASYRKRLVDALHRVGRYDEANRHLDAMANRETSDHTVLLLRADVAEAQEDYRASRAALDRAVRAFPNTAAVFARRAQLIIRQADSDLNDQLLRDALADLDSSVRLEPSNPTILRMRGQVHLELGQLDLAMRDLVAAVRANPSDDEFFQNVMLELTRIDRAGEAVTLAEHVLESRPGDPRLLTLAGAVFAISQDWDRALPFFDRAWRRVRDAQTGTQLVTVLLRLTPPRYAEARDVLAELGSQVENDWSLLMFRSQVLLRQGQTDPAQRDAIRAFRLVEADAGLLTAWFNRAQEAYRINEIVPLLDEVAKQTQRPNWVKLFRADALSKNDDTWPAAQRMLDELIAGEVEPQVRLNAFQSKSREQLRRGEHQAAVVTLRHAVQAFPDNWLMLNNLAYTLTENLRQPEEAVPFARRAADLVPAVGRADVLDTLGWSLALAGNFREAEKALEDALRIVGRGRSRPVVLLHLSYVKAKLGQRAAAEQHVESIRRIGREGLALPQDYAGTLSEVERMIQNLP
ncbi:MAG: tetratricopeptide repeat protein [Phycisphaeraceae bacterium]|nr:tetratricopeptide repeat protein [Phycisphaeraceae bacterium]MCW5753215.1 tetratricopeptide repeat protein [Phycisphaeraceae bacterium]